MSSEMREMREMVRAKIHEWRTDALEIRESDHAHRNLIAEEYEAHADELEALLARTEAGADGAVAAKILKEYWDLRPADPDLSEDIEAMRLALTKFTSTPHASESWGTVVESRMLNENGLCALAVRTERGELKMGDKIYTHPQDASGDAEADEKLKAIVAEYNDLIRHMSTGGDFFEFQAAMQAKEAK